MFRIHLYKLVRRIVDNNYMLFAYVTLAHSVEFILLLNNNTI